MSILLTVLLANGFPANSGEKTVASGTLIQSVKKKIAISKLEYWTALEYKQTTGKAGQNVNHLQHTSKLPL
jgi:hypothetical protein